MGLKMTAGRLKDGKAMKALFMMCWFAYLTCYLGRLNYSACLVEITSTEGWTKAQAGLVATAFFTCYGLGQLINGIMGDKISPKIMVTLGLGCSGFVNILFPIIARPFAAAILWCVNGFVQSMIWAPIIRMLSEWLPAEKRQNACVNMNGTVPVGTLAAYGLSAALVYISGWKAVFFASGIILIAVAAIWFITISRIEKEVSPSEYISKEDNTPAELRHISMGKLLIISAIPFVAVALVLQGMLKDGVTTWIPTFLEEQFGLTSAAAILSTTIVPIINLGGVYLASWLNKHLFKNEVLGAACFFAAGALSLAFLNFLPGSSAVISLGLLALTTTFMMGINTILASMMPHYYVNYGKCSTITGILNSSVYIGSAISSYANGAMVQSFGWDRVMNIWLICALVGISVCILAIRRWHVFSANAMS